MEMIDDLVAPYVKKYEEMSGLFEKFKPDFPEDTKVGFSLLTTTIQLISDKLYDSKLEGFPKLVGEAEAIFNRLLVIYNLENTSCCEIFKSLILYTGVDDENGTIPVGALPIMIDRQWLPPVKNWFAVARKCRLL